MWTFRVNMVYGIPNLSNLSLTSHGNEILSQSAVQSNTTPHNSLPPNHHQIRPWSYCIYPKYTDTLAIYHDCSKSLNKSILLAIDAGKKANRWVANSADPQQTATSSLDLSSLLVSAPNT